jgi:hypothetical protein
MIINKGSRLEGKLKKGMTKIAAENEKEHYHFTYKGYILNKT